MLVRERGLSIEYTATTNNNSGEVEEAADNNLLQLVSSQSWGLTMKKSKWYGLCYFVPIISFDTRGRFISVSLGRLQEDWEGYGVNFFKMIVYWVFK